MAGPPTAAFSQLVVKYGGPALPHGAVTTHGFTTPTAPLGDVEAAIASFCDALVTVMCNTVTILEVLWKVGPVASGPTVVYPQSLAGLITAQVSTPQVTALLKLPVAGASNRFAGRFYLPGVPEESTDVDGYLSPTYRNNVEAAAISAYDFMDAVGADPRVFSAASSDPRTVIAVQCDSRVATQRRRLRR